jgi:hypothetical protein
MPGSGRPVSEHRARPLVTAVWGDRSASPWVWTLGARGLDAGSSWWTPVWTGSGHGRRVRLSTPWREGCSARPWDGCGHDRPWTPVAVMDVAVRRGVRSGHHRPDARPHHGGVAHSGNRGRPAGQRRRTADKRTGCVSGPPAEDGRRRRPPRRAGLEPGTSSLSGFCTRAYLRRIAPATWANDVPLDTVGNRSVPMGCGPKVDQPAPAVARVGLDQWAPGVGGDCTGLDRDVACGLPADPARYHACGDLGGRPTGR